MGCSSLTDGLRVLAQKGDMEQWALGYLNLPEVSCFRPEVSCCQLFLAGFSSFSEKILPNFTKYGKIFDKSFQIW